MKPVNEHQPQQPEKAESEPAVEAIGLEYALGMLRETLAGDSKMLDFLQSIIDEPEPESDDPIVQEEYRSRMAFVAGMALSTEAKTDRTDEMVQQIREKLGKFGNLS